MNTKEVRFDIPTDEAIFKDFLERFPKYAKHVFDYRPGLDPYTIIVQLDTVSVDNLWDTLNYNYITKKVRR